MVEYTWEFIFPLLGSNIVLKVTKYVKLPVSSKYYCASNNGGLSAIALI